MVRQWVAILWLVIVACGDLAYLSWRNTVATDYIDVPLDVERATHRGGLAYTIPVDLTQIVAAALPGGFVARIDSDSLHASHRSSLIVLEDGRRIGPAHSLHSQIETGGDGRFSHWGQQIILSASDNSDVRTNGREYLALIPMKPHPMRLVLVGLLNVSGLLAIGALPLVIRASVVRLLGVIGAASIFTIVARPAIVTHADTLLPPVCFCLAILGAAGAWLSRLFGGSRSRQWSRLERRIAIASMRWIVPVAIGAGVLSVGASWGMEPGVAPDSHNFYAAYLGHVPATDASGYHLGAKRLLEDGTLDPWNHRRPLNAALLSVRILLGGHDLRLAILLQAILLGTAVGWASRVTGQVFGVWSGVAMFAFLHAEAQFHTPTLLSEGLGLTLSLVAFSMMLGGIQMRAPARFGWGFFAIALAMMARAGALFIMPALWLATIILFWRDRRRAVIVGGVTGIALVLGVSLNGLLLSVYGTDESVSNENFSYVILGLARNVLWSQADKGFESELAALPEREKASFRNRKAWELIREDPRPFVQASTTSLQKFFTSMSPRLASHVIPSHRLGFRLQPRVLHTITAIFAILVALALWRAGRNHAIFWMFAWLGIIASIPFIYLNGGWRVLASAYPFIVVPFAIALSTRPRRTVVEPASALPRQTSHVALLTTLAVVALIGPGLGRRLSSMPPESIRTGVEGELLLRSKTVLTAVAVAEDGVFLPRDMPRVSPTKYLRLLELARREDYTHLAEVEPPFLAMIAHDYSERRIGFGGRRMLFGSPRDLLAFRTPWVRVRYEQIGDTSLMRIVEAWPVEDSSLGGATGGDDQ